MFKASEIEAVLLSMEDPEQAHHLLRFFKTGPGQYGEGDRFIGLRNPQVRLVVKECWKETPTDEAVILARSPLHEVRLCGLLILVAQYLKAFRKRDVRTMNDIFDTYTGLHPYVNNWDLVDLSAIKIVGNHEVANPDLTIMEEWIQPEGHSLWQQRISMVSTWMLTRDGRPEVCLRRAGMLIKSQQDLLHKAAGWMLREVWKKGYRDLLREFLEENVAGMPSVMLSYACELMQPSERRQWQQKRKACFMGVNSVTL